MAERLIYGKAYNQIQIYKAGTYLKYIATREGVEKIDDSKKYLPATLKQKNLIKQILIDFPDTLEMLEYDDFQKEQTILSASEFISRALEDNAYQMMNAKTYADYIATRPRAERFGSHGLFTDDGVEIKLSNVSQELNQHVGNAWTAIVSLRREDASRLGFDCGERWRDMMRTQTQTIADNLKIPMASLNWFAAFHNESHHPHIHLIVYSNNPNEGFLTKKGLMNLRSAFAKDIFAQEMFFVYQKQTEHRDALKAESKNVLAEIIMKIENGSYENPILEDMLMQLAQRLVKTKGKKVYGYLKTDVKDIVDAIVLELSKDKRIACLYDLWYQQREEALGIYTKKMPQRIPLIYNAEFKSIKNAVIQEAMNIGANVISDDHVEDIFDQLELERRDIAENISDGETIEAEPMEIYFYSNDRQKKNMEWWTVSYLQARKYLYGTKNNSPDLQKAFDLMKTEAAMGNGFAMYDLGRMHLFGLGCEKDEIMGQDWFSKVFKLFLLEEVKVKKRDYLQYRIGKLYSFGYGVEKDYLEAADWYEKALENNNPFAAYALGSLYRRGQGVKQDNEKAFALFKLAADDPNKANAYAAYELGNMCKSGIGTKMDRVASEHWFKRAYYGFLSIEENMADDKLYNRLGKMNLNGIGTKLNTTKAKYYFEKAVTLGNADALYGLGILHLKKDTLEYNPEKAVDYLTKAAQTEHEMAQYKLGKLFLEGDIVAKDTGYALKLLDKAVKQGNQYAEYLLGKIFLQGVEVQQNIFYAETLLKTSANKGNSFAQYTLGKALLLGDLLVQNIPEAIRLLTESANNGCESAEYYLGKTFYQGYFIPKDLKKALDYLKKATAQGNASAAYLVGKILSTESSVKDVFQAIKYFDIAATTGNDYAEYQLGKLYLFGNDIEQNYEKAIAYLSAAASHGNQYAEQLLYSFHKSRNSSAAMGALRLLQHIGKLFQNHLTDERKDKIGHIERKLKRQIDEKKHLHGLKQS